MGEERVPRRDFIRIGVAGASVFASRAGASLAASILAPIVDGILAALLYDNFIRKADAPE